MKKLLYALLSFSFIFLACINQNASAQIVSSVTLSKTSLANTDTSKATLSVDRSAVSVEVKVNKTSGTIAGTVKLQGTFDNVNYDDLNTLTLADQALNRKVMAIPTPLTYPVYRVIFISSGSNATTVSAKQLRRTDY